MLGNFTLVDIVYVIVVLTRRAYAFIVANTIIYTVVVLSKRQICLGSKRVVLSDNM